MGKSKLKLLFLAIVLITVFFHVDNIYGADHINNDTTIQSVEIDADNDKSPEFKVSLYNTRSDVKYVVQAPHINTYKYMTSKIYKLVQYRNGKKTGYVNLTLKSLSDNNNWMFFVNYYSDEDNIKLKYDIIAYNKQTNVDILTFPNQNGKYVLKRQKASSKVTLSNKVTYLESANRYVKFGETIAAKGLGSTVCEIYKYKADSVLTKTKDGFNSQVVLNSIAKREIRGNWLLSVNPMVDWSHKTAFNTMLKMDFETGTIFFSDGLYRENMSNYVPRSSSVKTYFKNPSGLQVRACKWVLDKGSLFKTVGVYSMYAFADSIGNNGYIPTQPMSEWLKKDFNISYNFYDTRFNSDTMNSLIYIYQDYPDKYVLNKMNKYFYFYKKYYKTKQYKVGKAIFVPDYMDISGKNKINPTSLNHFIAETEVMFLYYNLTGDKESHKIALEMLNSIKLTSNKWIRSSGDLWYRVTPEGVYKTNDYPLVTYNDLVFLKHILKTVEGIIPAEIEKMYQNKEKWAKNQGFL